MIEIWKLALTQLPEPFCSEDATVSVSSLVLSVSFNLSHSLSLSFSFLIIFLSLSICRKIYYSIFRERIALFHLSLPLYIFLSLSLSPLLPSFSRTQRRNVAANCVYIVRVMDVVEAIQSSGLARRQLSNVHRDR